MEEKSIEELLQFLAPKAPEHLKKVALENIVGLTATTEGRLFFRKHESLIGCTANLVLDDVKEISEVALTCLVNLSADAILAEKLIETNNSELIRNLLDIIVRRRVPNPHEGLSCKILNNLSTQAHCARKIYRVIVEAEKYDVAQLIELFCDERVKHEYHHLAGVLCNLSQLGEMRRRLTEAPDLLKRLIPYTLYADSNVRREGIVGTIRNCCFDSDVHEILFNDDLELLVYLLLPLTGPEEYDDDEMSLLPLQLQYLGADKTRDTNAKVRKMILEALTQLCATKFGRKRLRDQNAYLVLRELHKSEQTAAVKLACENVIQILINDEPTGELENLKNAQIPADLKAKFEKMDSDALNDAENELKT